MTASPASDVLHRLSAVIDDRKANPSAASYTCQLLAGGVPAIAAKIREESGELVEAAAETGADAHGHVIHEAADLVYHLLVLLADRGVSLAEVEQELARRFGISGLAEKASRASRNEPS